MNTFKKFLISDFRRDLNIEYVLLGISPASNCSWPTFRNLYRFHLQRLVVDCLPPAFEDGTDTGFRNVGQLQIDAGEIPKRTFSVQSSLFITLQVHSTCFGCQQHPSSGEHKTVTTASGTGHIFCAATSLQRGQVNSGVNHTHHQEYTKL